MDIFGKLFAALILGHLIGDYLLQTRGMAMNKTGNTLRCMFHCLVYTVAVSICTWPHINGLWWSMLVFASHFPIDRWSLADKWLDFIDGRSLKHFMVHGKEDIPVSMDYENYHSLRGGFTAVVYAVADNTMHLAIMWYGALYLMSNK
jgi:hypothetical protein